MTAVLVSSVIVVTSNFTVLKRIEGWWRHHHRAVGRNDVTRIRTVRMRPRRISRSRMAGEGRRFPTSDGEGRVGTAGTLICDTVVFSENSITRGLRDAVLKTRSHLLGLARRCRVSSSSRPSVQSTSCILDATSRALGVSFYRPRCMPIDCMRKPICAAPQPKWPSVLKGP